MSKVCALLLCAATAALAGCGPKINDPADVAAIRQTFEDFARGMSAGDADAAAAVVTDKVVWADNHVPVASGKEAAKGVISGFINFATLDVKVPVDEVRVTGDTAVARGTYTIRLTPKTKGMAAMDDGGSWMATCTRQADGTWKWDAVVANSSTPAPGSTATGEDEMALIQLEHQWEAAGRTKDAAAVEKLLADDFVSNFEGRVSGKKQFLAEMKANPASIESATAGDMRTFVFGTMALVDGVYVEKSTTAGKDSSMRVRFTEVYAKRDGRWLCVTQYLSNVK